VLNRPLVEQTAVEASAADGGSALAFFDDLETRPLASQDDAINACLLLGTGATAPSYEQRVAMAEKLGYIPREYNRPARQAVTMGEVATMSVKLLEGRRLSQEDALSKLMQRNIAPASARYNQGLTGAQLVSLTGGLRDAMRIEGVGRVAPPSVPPPAPAPAAESTAGSGHIDGGPPVPPDASISTDGVALSEAAKDQGKAGATAGKNTSPVNSGPAPAPQSASSSNKSHSEPLPKLLPGNVPPAIDIQDPKAKPSIIGPDAKVITPGQPKSQPKRVVEPKAEPATPATPEPKPQAQARPNANPTMQPTGAQASVDKTKAGNRLWTIGQPVKKTASAEESK
jgi:hypothetical protein